MHNVNDVHPNTLKLLTRESIFMGKQKNESITNTDEFTRIFDEYRAKIDEITRKTEQNLRHIHGNTDIISEPEDIEIDEVETLTEETAPEPVEVETVPEVQPEPASKPVEVIWPSNKESVDIIKQAKRKAQELISQAESSIKKEARQRTRAQVEKLLNKAKKEAEYIVVHARDTAEELRNEAIASSRQEVEQALSEITEKCRQDARAQSSRVVAEAREKADRMMADITASSSEINRLVTEIVNRSKNTISEFEERLQEETGELTKAITETQKKLEEATMIEPEPEPAPVPEPDVKTRGAFSNPTLEVRLIDENSNGNNGYLGLYSGQMEMRTTSATFDYQYMKKLKKFLVGLPGIKYLQESASEKEMSVLFNIEEPLPLLDILREVPLVEKVVTGSTDNNDISLVFKNSF